MAVLPFVVQPKFKPIIERIGNEEIGVLEIKRQGFLSVTEKAFLQEGAGNDQVATLILSLVRKISTEFKIPPERAHTLIMDLLTNTPSKDKLFTKVADTFPSDIAEITEVAIRLESKKEFLRAYCMIVNRIDPNFEVSDVTSLHPDLITELSKLCEDEENKSTERILNSMANKEFANDNEELIALEKK